MSRQSRYETRDAPTIFVIIGLGGILVTLLIGLGLARLVLPSVGHQPVGPPHGPATRSAIPLETKPGATLAQVQARGLDRLAHGPVPIDQAMAQVAQRGWADADAASGKPSEGQP